MGWQMILLIILVIIFLIIPLLTFIIKTAVTKGILDAYDILQNKKGKDKTLD